MIFHRKGKSKKNASSSNDEPSSLSNKSSANVELTKPVFNVPLNVALENMPSADGIPVVALVRNCIDYVTDHGLDVEGIYRISASKNALDELEKAVNYGEHIQFDDAHEAANLLKRFLRGLPEHILTKSLKPEVEQIASQCKCSSTEPCRCEVASFLAEYLSMHLPAANYYLLAYVFLHAQSVVLHSKENKMTLSALGVLLQAILKLSKNEVRIFLLNASSLLLNENDEPVAELFTGIPFERYNHDNNEAGRNDFPTSDGCVESELSRQERLLSDINEQLNLIVDKKSIEAREKERQIWKIQQSIDKFKQQVNTQLTHNSTSNSPGNSCEESQPSPIQVGSLPPVFLEKQLLAVQGSLQDDVIEEKRRIAQLLTRLRKIQNELPPEMLESIEKFPPLPSSQPLNSSRSETGAEDDADKLVAKRVQLLNEVTYYRDLCARLRSRYEQCTVLLNTVRQTKATPPPPSSSSVQLNAEESAPTKSSSLLVTRF